LSLAVKKGFRDIRRPAGLHNQFHAANLPLLLSDPAEPDDPIAVGPEQPPAPARGGLPRARRRFLLINCAVEHRRARRPSPTCDAGDDFVTTLAPRRRRAGWPHRDPPQSATPLRPFPLTGPPRGHDSAWHGCCSFPGTRKVCRAARGRPDGRGRVPGRDVRKSAQVPARLPRRSWSQGSRGTRVRSIRSTSRALKAR